MSVVTILLSLIGCVIAAAAGLLLLASKKKSSDSNAIKVANKAFERQYVRKEPMTATEMEFFQRLVKALPSVVVAPQVALAALVDVVEHQSKGKFAHVNRSQVSQQRVDYVLFDRETGQALCVLELDDHTHDSAKAKENDAKRDSLLASVGYAVFRFDARKMPSVEELRAKFED